MSITPPVKSAGKSALADLITGYLGKDLVVQEFIYNSFLVITLGCFGIAGVEKIFSQKNKEES